MPLEINMDWILNPAYGLFIIKNRECNINEGLSGIDLYSSQFCFQKRE